MPIAPPTRPAPRALGLAAALALVAAAPLPAQQLPALAPAPFPDLVLAQATASEDLVRLFTEFYQRHPIGSTLAPSTLRILSATEAAALPALPTGQRYAEIEGLIVKIDAAYRLVGIARRAPTTTAQAPTPAPAPAPSGDSTADATANANANATVNININDERDEEEERRGGDDDDCEEGLTIAEAEAEGIRIPGGHRPEAGMCRYWQPGTPPGRQPRGLVDCDDDNIPRGTVLICG